MKLFKSNLFHEQEPSDKDYKVNEFEDRKNMPANLGPEISALTEHEEEEQRIDKKDNHRYIPVDDLPENGSVSPEDKWAENIDKGLPASGESEETEEEIPDDSSNNGKWTRYKVLFEKRSGKKASYEHTPKYIDDRKIPPTTKMTVDVYEDERKGQNYEGEPLQTAHISSFPDKSGWSANGEFEIVLKKLGLEKDYKNLMDKLNKQNIKKKIGVRKELWDILPKEIQEKVKEIQNNLSKK
jgi:hypothetical protein